MSTELNIAIDASFLALPNSGIGRYSTNLVREFAALQSPHRIFLYTDRPFQLQFPLPEHWTVRTGNQLILRILSILRLRIAFEQVVFPAWARKDGIDVYWSPINHLPVLLPSHIRKVFTLHDIVCKRFPQTVPRRLRAIEALLVPLSLRIADRVITDAQFTRSEVLAVFPEAKGKIDVVYLASNLRAEGETGSCPVSIPYFLFVGSNEPRKNLKRLLQAYIQYRKLSPSPIDLVIAGTYQWGEFSVIDFIQTNDLQPWVHVIQNADDTVLRALYAHAQALVMVSIYEGFGLPLVEAMQWAIPLIASNNSSVAEIAGDAALLVDPYDTDAIAQALRRMAEDPAIHSELACKSRIRGHQFSWKQAAAEVMASIVGDPAVEE
jgi:glycosyltransferase involved in cell wall biosynthesis